MKSLNQPDPVSIQLLVASDLQTSDSTIAQLVGQVYAVAPATDRCRILEKLMKPLGVLPLVAVANGVFAKLWFRSGWHELRIAPDDTQVVQPNDVVSLVQYVQQASIETLNGLSQVLTSSPQVACTAAATLLVAVLVRQARQRHDDKQFPEQSPPLSG
jgi:hypothetical protein